MHMTYVHKMLTLNCCCNIFIQFSFLQNPMQKNKASETEIVFWGEDPALVFQIFPIFEVSVMVESV